MRGLKVKQAGAAATAPGPNVVKAGGLTTSDNPARECGQPIPALIAIHLGTAFLERREGGAL